MQSFAAPANPVRIVQSCRTQENLDFYAETASSLSAYRVCAASKLPRQDDEAKASRSAIGSAEDQERTFGLASSTSSASFLFPVCIVLAKSVAKKDLTTQLVEARTLSLAYLK